MMARFGTFFRGKKLERERAIGDGSCAFNAFLLGLCQKDILNWLDRQSPEKNHAKFIQAAAKALDVLPTWKSVRKELAKEGESNRRHLQRSLQTLIRQMALDKAERDHEYYEKTEVVLIAVLNRFLHSNRAEQEDDMFLKHAFIEDKFIALKIKWTELQETLTQQVKRAASVWWNRYESSLIGELRPNQSISKNERLQIQFFFERALLRYLQGEKAFAVDEDYLKNATIAHSFAELKKMVNDSLEQAEAFLTMDAQNWWRETGFPAFIKIMRQDGEFAGDIELKQLGVEFGVNICNQRPDEPPYYIHIDHGVLPIKDSNKKVFSKGQVMELRSRGIIDPPMPNDNVLKLTLVDEVEIEKRLQRIPDYKVVKRFLVKHKDNLRNVFFPQAAVSSECINELVLRNIINKRNNNYVFNLFDVEEILIRARMIVGKNRLLAYIKKHKVERPHIVLANVGKEHWDHVRLVTDNIELLRYNIAKWHNEPEENKWEKLIKRVFLKEKETIALSKKADVSNRSMFFTEYQLPGNQTMLVSRKDQEALDHAYAFKIQEEELQAFEKSCLKK